MIEEVMRDPISVKQLKVNGQRIMELTKAEPGPYIGFILEILLSEVLDDPKLNNVEYLEKKVSELYKLPTNKLADQGKQAREKNANEDEREVEKIKQSHGVK